MVCMHCGAEKMLNPKTKAMRWGLIILGAGAVLAILLEIAPGGEGMGAYFFVVPALFGASMVIGSILTKSDDPTWHKKN